MELKFMEFKFHLKRHYRTPLTQLGMGRSKLPKKKNLHGTRVLGA